MVYTKVLKIISTFFNKVFIKILIIQFNVFTLSYQNNNNTQNT